MEVLVGVFFATDLYGYLRIFTDSFYIFFLWLSVISVISVAVFVVVFFATDLYGSLRIFTDIHGSLI